MLPLSDEEIAAIDALNRAANHGKDASTEDIMRFTCAALENWERLTLRVRLDAKACKDLQHQNETLRTLLKHSTPSGVVEDLLAGRQL